VQETTLYFAYGSLLDPDRIHRAAPGSRFLFTAHYPETKLDFVASAQNGAIPTLIKESGHTVWGGVFEIPQDQVDGVIEAEAAEGRKPGYDLKAVDREGNKYDCLTFVATDEPNGDHKPDREYLDSMINGARHWRLPAGWVMGLEDLADDPLFS
jgi:cation transport regulator ChaC